MKNFFEVYVYLFFFRTRQEEAKISMTYQTATVILEPNLNLSSSINYSYSIDNSPDGATEYQDNGIILETSVALYIYGAITVAAVIVIFARAFIFFKAGILASKNLHAKMLRCVLLAPMKFFNVNPCGRILNRFSNDMGATDDILPRVLFNALQVTVVI